jgi:RNA polymerase sigma factor for flagellar operon FliA
MTAEQKELLTLGMAIVRRVAYRIIVGMPSWVDVRELIAAGNEGLLEAIRDYDPQTCPSFEVYARKRIRGAMYDERRAYDSLTRYGRRKLHEVERATHALELVLGRRPTSQETAEALELDLPSYHRMIDGVMRWKGLAGWDDFADDDGPCDDASPEESCIADDMKMCLAAAMKCLPVRKRRVLELHFECGMKLKDVGRTLCMTESRACQIVKEATTQLREILDDDDSPHDMARAVAGVVSREILDHGCGSDGATRWQHESPATARSTSWAASWPQRRPLSACPEVGACGV